MTGSVDIMADLEEVRRRFAESGAAVSVQPDLLIDIISDDGHILWSNETQLERLGIYGAAVTGMNASAFYTVESYGAIQQLLRGGGRTDLATTLELTLMTRSGRSIRCIARARAVQVADQSAVQLIKMEMGAVGNSYRRLESDYIALKGILETANEAHWGNFFLEPVDTTLPKEEVINQVFENQSVWRMCNPAMARLYQLPETLDFNEQDVRLYWPRSAANERFVEEIITSGYAIKDALSVDRRHDGTLQYILNDVRGEVVDGYLLRLWGNCRDVTTQHNADDAAANALKLTMRAFDGLPDPVLILDREGKVLSRNKAYATAYSTSRTLDARLLAFIRTRRKTEGWTLFDNSGGGALSLLVDVHLRRIEGSDGHPWTVVTLRDHKAEAIKPPPRPRKRSVT
jgi:PAS domain-containing protein